ncbi:protoporphyrinogen/coproporphyrinogen oxidase [Leucobacter sp. HY1910]
MHDSPAAHPAHAHPAHAHPAHAHPAHAHPAHAHPAHAHPSHTQAYDAVVIGGGVAGLVTARDLSAAGLGVCLIEAGRTLGGRVQRTRLAGLPVELGAEAFATRDGSVLALAHELGMGEAVTRPAAASAWVVTAAAAHPLPASGALGVPTRPLRNRGAIGLPTALWVATEPWRPRTKHAPGASVADVARARIGARATTAFVAPVVEGVYSAAPEKLPFDAQHDLARAYARTGSLVRAAREVRRASLAAGGAVASFVGGLSQLVTRLETDLSDRGVALRTNSEVTGLTALPPAAAAAPEYEPAPDQPSAAGPQPRWRVQWTGGECVAHTVILAVPPAVIAHLTAHLTAHLKPGGADFTADFTAETCVETVTLVVDSAALNGTADRPGPRGTGALIRQPHPRIAAKALTHATAKWPWLREITPTGRHVLRLSYGSRDVPPATSGLDDETAAALALRDAAAVLGVELDQAQLVSHARARWRIPASARPCALPPGLRCTGEAYAGTGLASVIPHARAVARNVSHAHTHAHSTTPTPTSTKELP